MKLKWRVTGASGQPGVNARGNVEDLRAGAGFVIPHHLAMAAQTVTGNFSKLLRGGVLNVKISH